MQERGLGPSLVLVPPLFCSPCRGLPCPSTLCTGLQGLPSEGRWPEQEGLCETPVTLGLFTLRGTLLVAGLNCVPSPVPSSSGSPVSLAVPWIAGGACGTGWEEVAPRAVYRSDGVSCSLLAVCSVALYQNRSRSGTAPVRRVARPQGLWPGQDESRTARGRRCPRPRAVTAGLCGAAPTRRRGSGPEAAAARREPTWVQRPWCKTSLYGTLYH